MGRQAQRTRRLSTRQKETVKYNGHAERYTRRVGARRPPLRPTHPSAGSRASRAHSTMDRQEAVKWGATGSADTAGGLVDLSNVRRMSLADNNVPVATGMFQERRAQDGPGGRSPGKGVSSWFGWRRNTDSTTQAEEVMQRKSADAARFLGTRSSAHSGKVQVHPSAQKHRLASADQPFWLRCIPDRCCSCLNSQPATPGELRGLSKLRSDRARARAEDVQARLSQQA